MLEHKRKGEVLGEATPVVKLVARVLDSYEKLEITMYLYRVRFSARPTASIGDALALPPNATWDAVAALARAGVIRTMDPEGGGWWFDPNSRWAAAVEALAALYARDRLSVLEMMTNASLERLRAHAAHRFPAIGKQRSSG